MAVNLRIWRPRFSRLSAYPDRNPRILTIKCQPTPGSLRSSPGLSPKASLTCRSPRPSRSPTSAQRSGSSSRGIRGGRSFSRRDRFRGWRAKQQAGHQSQRYRIINKQEISVSLRVLISCKLLRVFPRYGWPRLERGPWTAGVDVNRTSRSLAEVEEQYRPTVAAQPQDSAVRAHSWEAHETDAKGK